MEPLNKILYREQIFVDAVERLTKKIEGDDSPTAENVREHSSVIKMLFRNLVQCYTELNTLYTTGKEESEKADAEIKETITGVEKEIENLNNQLNAEIIVLRDAISQLESEVGSLDTRLEAVEDSVSDLSDTVSHHDEDLEVLTAGSSGASQGDVWTLGEEGGEWLPASGGEGSVIDTSCLLDDVSGFSGFTNIYEENISSSANEITTVSFDITKSSHKFEEIAFHIPSIVNNMAHCVVYVIFGNFKKYISFSFTKIYGGEKFSICKLDTSKISSNDYRMVVSFLFDASSSSSTFRVYRKVTD